MADPNMALATQLANIEKRTGKTLADYSVILRDSGFAKHGEMRDFLKREHGMGHGDANTLVHMVLNPQAPAAPGDGGTGTDALDEIYAGPKAALRPIHEALMARITPLGDFEIAPKKANVSLRRKKQFALIGPATNTRVELGLNMKGVAATDRLIAMPAGGMCNYKVKLTGVEEVDDELIAWVQTAYESAG